MVWLDVKLLRTPQSGGAFRPCIGVLCEIVIAYWSDHHIVSETGIFPEENEEEIALGMDGGIITLLVITWPIRTFLVHSEFLIIFTWCDIVLLQTVAGRFSSSRAPSNNSYSNCVLSSHIHRMCCSYLRREHNTITSRIGYCLNHRRIGASLSSGSM